MVQQHSIWWTRRKRTKRCGEMIQKHFFLLASQQFFRPLYERYKIVFEDESIGGKWESMLVDETIKMMLPWYCKTGSISLVAWGWTNDLWSDWTLSTIQFWTIVNKDLWFNQLWFVISIFLSLTQAIKDENEHSFSIWSKNYGLAVQYSPIYNVGTICKSVKTLKRIRWWVQILYLKG